MRVADWKTPIAVGEDDWRALRFTKVCDGETPLNPRVVCTFIGPSGSDPSPQSRILTVAIQTSVSQLKGPLNTPVTESGEFLVIYFGNAPSTAAGGYYLVQGLVDTPTRIGLSVSARLLCAPA